MGSGERGAWWKGRWSEVGDAEEGAKGSPCGALGGGGGAVGGLWPAECRGGCGARWGLAAEQVHEA